MKLWNEIERDAFSYFEWDCDKERIISGNRLRLSLFSVNGIRINKNEFINSCVDVIQQAFSQKELADNYKLYLLANVEVRDKSSRIEKYSKVWKKLQTEWQLEGFTKGPEVEVTLGENLLYSSIAQFSLDKIKVALELISKNSYKFTIISSSRNDILTEDSVRDIFNSAFKKSDLKYPVINYCNLSLDLCSKADIVFRWGDSSEDAGVALIFSPELSRIFESIC